MATDDASKWVRSRLTVAAGFTTAVLIFSVVQIPAEASMAEPGSISGTVTVEGVPTAGVEVNVELISASPELGWTTTGQDGKYQITGLTPGDYEVSFSLEGYLQKWWNNRFEREMADAVSVQSALTTSGINANLTKGGTISGRVGDEEAGLPGQVVEVYDLDGIKTPYEETTDELGEYEIGFMNPGTYRVLYTDKGIWYSGQTSFASADEVEVIDDQTTSNIDFVVSTKGSISGTVLGEYFGPVPDVAVGLFDAKLELIATQSTDLDGEFSFDNLPVGIYYLFATDPLEEFADTWHLDAPSFDSAFGVFVELSQDVTDKNILMQSLAPAGFTDVSDSVFEADIVWLATEGITKGCNPPTNDRYCPDDFVTRGQMAAFLVRALGYIDDGGGDLFVDDDGNTFEADIDKLATAGVTKGCNPPTNNRYCPGDLVTRGQMAAFLVRALGYIDDGGGDLFVDDDQSIFEKDIDRLGTAGVTKGCNPPLNDRFCPGDFVTRGQMAAFLRRALGS